ncbi:MAG: Dihydroxyacetone kinase, ATP-dependent, partial [uncultured Thermomicrobiales bacterium]
AADAERGDRVPGRDDRRLRRRVRALRGTGPGCLRGDGGRRPPGGQGRGGGRRRLGALPGLLRPGRAGDGDGRGDRRDLHQPLRGAGVSGRQGRRRRGGDPVHLRQLRRRRDEFRHGRGAVAGRGGRCSNRAGHRRRAGGAAGGSRGSARHRRRLLRVQGGRGQRRARRRFGNGGSADQARQRADPDHRRRLRRLHGARPGRAVVHRRAGSDGDRSRHPRRTGGADQRADALPRDRQADGRQPGRRSAAGRREPGGGAGQRPRRDQVRGAVRPLRRHRAAAGGGRDRAVRAADRRVRDLARHGRLLVDVALVGRRPAGAARRAGGDPGLYPRRL